MDLKDQLVKLGKSKPKLRKHLRYLPAAVDHSTYKKLASDLKRDGWYIQSVGWDHVRVSHEDLNAKWVEVRLEEDVDPPDALTMSIHFDNLRGGEELAGIRKNALKGAFYDLLDKTGR